MTYRLLASDWVIHGAFRVHAAVWRPVSANWVEKISALSSESQGLQSGDPENQFLFRHPQFSSRKSETGSHSFFITLSNHFESCATIFTKLKTAYILVLVFLV